MKAKILCIVLFIVFIVGCSPPEATDVEWSDDTVVGIFGDLVPVAAEDSRLDDSFPVQDYAVLGDPDADVTFYEFSDYQCTFCKKFTTQILPELKEEYIDTNRIRFVFNDFPLAIHKEGIPSAVAAHCAGEQGEYFAYHDVLFEKSKELSSENYLVFAEELGLEMNEFESCLDDPEQEAKVTASYEAGKAAGIRGTPTMFINDKKMAGAQSFDSFKEVLDELLGDESVEVKGDACEVDLDCGEARSFGPMCSTADETQFCSVSSTPSCIKGECVVIIEEECSSCDVGQVCSEGVCA